MNFGSLLASDAKDHKKKGLMSAIFRKALEMAQERRLHYITLNTFPDRLLVTKRRCMHHLIYWSIWKALVNDPFCIFCHFTCHPTPRDFSFVQKSEVS